MSKYLLFMLLFASSVILKAQRNLVPNPGFEERTSSPPSKNRNYVYKRERAIANGWRQATCGSVDYFNSDSSSFKGEPLHLAHAGRGRIGILLDKRRDSFIYFGQDTSGYDWEYKEYAQAHLLKALEKNKIYCVSFYLALDVRSAFRASSVGAYFSKDSVLGDAQTDKEDSIYAGHIPQINYGPPLFYTPQVFSTDTGILSCTKHWTKVSGCFVAQGGERYITLGSFGHSTPVSLCTFLGYHYNLFYPGAYYYMDDVSVEEVADTLKEQKVAPSNNFVLVLDVSESMRENGKMEALKRGVDSLLDFMGDLEKISVITFDAAPKVLVENMYSSQKSMLIQKIDSLKPSGGTNVPVSIKKAYDIINETYLAGGNNRVILITDAGYRLSAHSKDIIWRNYKDKDIHFSTLVFNNVRLRKIKRTCVHTGGTCSAIAGNELASSIKDQVAVKKAGEEKPGRDGYSGPVNYIQNDFQIREEYARNQAKQRRAEKKFYKARNVSYAILLGALIVLAVTSK